MIDMPWPLALLGLPLWFGPPLLLVIAVSRARVVRIAFGAMLAAALTFLYAVVAQLLQGPRLPIWIEGLVLWGPTTLVVCGAAFLSDRWISRRQASRVGTGSDAGSRPAVRRTAGPLLAAAFIGWSACCGGCVFSPAAEAFDLRIDSPTPGLVQPMPDDLTLVSADRDCGSEWCSEIYRVGSPDQASVSELRERLWAHLVADKGWTRLRDDAGCQRPGWFIREEFCLFVDVDQAGPAAMLEVHVTGALSVA